MMGLTEKIEILIFERRKQRLEMPKLIVMHPNTWVELVREMASFYAETNFGKKFEYRGIRILRSCDLSEKEIEIE